VLGISVGCVEKPLGSVLVRQEHGCNGTIRFGQNPDSIVAFRWLCGIDRVAAQDPQPCVNVLVILCCVLFAARTPIPMLMPVQALTQTRFANRRQRARSRDNTTQAEQGSEHAERSRTGMKPSGSLG